jgi:hypothetical protein
MEGEAMADSAEGHPRLDWSTAEVSGGELVIELKGELPKGWPKSFDATAQLLDNGQWGSVRVKKGSVRVGGVSGGDEEKLRHFLESVVQQANADHAVDEQQPDDPAEPDQAEHDQAGDVDQQADAEMTERFRAFSGAGEEDASAGDA